MKIFFKITFQVVKNIVHKLLKTLETPYYFEQGWQNFTTLVPEFYQELSVSEPKSFEEQLIEGCLKNERLSQKKLFEFYFQEMYMSALRYTKNTEEAMDVCQDGFIKVFAKLHTFSGTGSLKAWIKSVIIHTALDHYRKNKREAVIGYELEEDVRVESNIEENITADEILAVINLLPEMQKLVFNLYVMEDLPHREIAEHLAISEGTSKWHLCEARKSLKKKIEIMYPIHPKVYAQSEGINGFSGIKSKTNLKITNKNNPKILTNK